MGPIVQFATEKPDAAHEIRIYPGANGRFTVYEDDNETYDYEKGRSARYEMVWDDASRTLRIGARSGTFRGMGSRRQLDLVIVDAGNASGVSPAMATRSVTYEGKPIEVRF
jgi:alpha-D-xyloside xylohydrolase